MESDPPSANCDEDNIMSGVNPSSSGITAESSDGGDAEASSDGKEEVMSDGEEEEVDNEDEEDDDDDEDLEIPLNDLVKNMDDKVSSELGGTAAPKSPIRIRLKVPPPPTKTDRNDDENEDRKSPVAIQRLPSSASASIQKVDCGGNNLSPTPPTPPPRKRSSGPTYPNLQPNRGSGQGSHPRHMSRNGGTAGHRNRQIHVPPIGSPGLLMLPNYANMPEGRGLQQSDLIYIPNAHGDAEDYVLPSTVFRESMIAGGYTTAVRSGTYYYRGSSTERSVGDMFDCDAGPRLYLHFPDLLPEALWNRRLGDAERARQARKEASDSRRLGSVGGSGSGGGTADQFPSFHDAFDSSLSLKAGPKGARSSYIFFTNTQRPLICEQFPGLKFTEQGVIMGERWRALTPEEKKPYEDMANADKERHAKETREYIDEFRQEMKISGGQDNALNSSMEGSKDAGEELQTETMDEDDVPITKKDDGQIRGPRLVDEVILGLSKMLGQEMNRRVTVPIEPVIASKEHDVTSTNVTTDGVKLEEGPSVLESTPVILRQVSPDLTSDELPSFVNPVRAPQTHPHPSPHVPMSFLDMLPVSLTATYPTSYVAKRREYLLAVQAREDAIIAAQEAKDDADDAEEKYLGQVEAWERMLEYQKVQIAKREDEFKRERELFDATVKEAGDNSIDKDKSADAVNIIEAEMDEATDAVGGSTADDEVKEEKRVRPTTPTPEDPMDYMPSRPQRPGPPRIIPIPDIPIPPSPPPVTMVGSEIDRQDEMNGTNGDVDAASMMLPMVDQKLVQHLDPACFIPNMSGRYLGLLSNHIADPQFCGPLAPGIVGNTIGGGTGLATSYPGGGRGSGPVRGGASTWHSSLGSSNGVKTSAKEKVVVTADEVTSSEAVAIQADITSSDPSLATATLKRQPSGGDVVPCSSKNNKKQKKAPAFILTTGDRNTTALEVASGPADSDFPEGWIMKTYRRSGGETVGKTDKFWFSPGRNIRFRARKHAMSFLAVMKEPGVDGDEDKAAAIYKTRGLHF